MPHSTCTSDGCTKAHRARGLCSTHYNQANARYLVTCTGCGEEFRSSRTTGKLCSDECRSKTYTGRHIRTRALVGPVEPQVPTYCALPARHPARIAPRKARLWYAGTCAWCAASFTDWQPLARYCSPKCGTRAGDSRRRKRKGQLRLTYTYAQRVVLYERDAWTCQLCLEPVDSALMDARPNDDWAPSLDHIIPRALGGPDDVTNLRLAHRWCNSVRSDETHYTAEVLQLAAHCA